MSGFYISSSPSLFCKLGSLAVHVEEFLSDDGHEFDKASIDSLLSDHEMKLFLRQLREQGLLPEKRS